MAISLDGANGITTPSISSANAISLPSGSASTPALAPSDDTNTGIFFPAADTIAFAEGGAEAMRLDANGNVGIGQSSPSQKLDVNGNIVTDSYSLGAGNGIFLRKGYETNAQPSITVEDHSGSAPDGLSVNGGDGVSFRTGGTERARIDASGNLLVGETSQGGSESILLGRPANTATYIRQFKLTQAECTWGFKSSTDTNMYIGSGSPNIGTYGVYLTNGGNSWNAVSDERMKTIVEPIENAAAKVSTLRSVIGYYNHDEKQIRRPFLIAQDVQAVLPEAVNIQDEETGTLGMSYTDTIPLLVAAIQELKAINDVQASRIETLESEVAALKSQNIN